MFQGRSRLLLAGIPAGTLLVGLLWLKRRRSRQTFHHTDPGGSLSEILDPVKNLKHKEEIEKEKFLIEKEDIVLSSNEKDSISECCTLEEDVIREFLEEETLDRVVSCEIGESLVVNKELSASFGEIKEVISAPHNSISINGVLETEEDLAKNYIQEQSHLESRLAGSGTCSTAEIAVVEENLLDSLSVSITEENSLQFELDSLESEEKVDKEEEGNIGEEVVEGDIEELQDDIVISEGIVQETIQEEASVNSSVEEEGDKEVVEEVVLGEAAAAIMKTPPTQLVEKLASLELDTMKLREETANDKEQKGCSERDSANHSPSEVMLASPSISNFSDAHSEGSSDSGKGHSDVATSPSRTPAGGSSLAGDLAPSLYEFVLPQVIVGRLIGRRGSFLHEIRSSTQTNIYIKKHPETNKLKICAIEGSQQDIDKALTKIRQKFPLRRFPQLTLEKVSFVTLNPPPLKLEDFNLQLVQGVNNDVILSSLITAAHFFLQQPSQHSYGSLATLNHIMNQVYTTGEAPTLQPPIKDAVCAAPTMGGWYRAQIVNLDEDGGTSTVRFLDYGGYLTIESNCLRQIRGDLLALPFQAVECYLANVIPAGNNGWSEEARIFVHNLTLGQILQAQIYDYAEDGTPLVYLYASYGSQVILINEELVMKGYAVLTTPATTTTSTSPAATTSVQE